MIIQAMKLLVLLLPSLPKHLIIVIIIIITMIVCSGLAFLVPYLLALFLLGVPLLKLETGMGQLLQCGVTKGFAKVNKVNEK